MSTLKEGDFVLVTGFAHFEKAKVIAIKKTGFQLDNNMVIDKNFNNVVKSSMKAEPWDEDKYNILRAEYLIPARISSISRNWKYLKNEEKINLFNKLSRIIEKYNL